MSERKRRTRRDFIRGKFAADAEIFNWSEAAAADEAFFLRVERDAMASHFEVRMNLGQYESGTEAAIDALDVVNDIEEQLSFFLSDSEISRINRDAAAEPVVLDDDLFELIESAVRFYEETDRSFDITATPLWELWGFAMREARIPTDDEIDRALQSVGSNHIELDREDRTIRFTDPSSRINLGGIGKGYAIDRVADRLLVAGIDNYLIHGGASSVAARGAQSVLREGWIVGIAHPTRESKRLAEIRLVDQALATSGGRHQSFMHRGRRLSHIIDPRSGRPAEGTLAVTVAAPNATTADVLSTAFFVLGPDRALEYCDTHPELSVIIVLAGSGGRELEILQSGFDESTFRIL